MDYWRSYNNGRALNNLFESNELTWKMLPFHSFLSKCMNEIQLMRFKFQREKKQMGIRRPVNEKFNGNVYS